MTLDYVPVEILVTGVDAAGEPVTETGDYEVGAELEVACEGVMTGWLLYADGEAQTIPCRGSLAVHEGMSVEIPPLLKYHV